METKETTRELTDSELLALCYGFIKAADNQRAVLILELLEKRLQIEKGG